MRRPGWPPRAQGRIRLPPHRKYRPSRPSAVRPSFWDVEPLPPEPASESPPKNPCPPLELGSGPPVMASTTRLEQWVSPKTGVKTQRRMAANRRSDDEFKSGTRGMADGMVWQTGTGWQESSAKRSRGCRRSAHSPGGPAAIPPRAISSKNHRLRCDPTAAVGAVGAVGNEPRTGQKQTTLSDLALRKKTPKT